MGNSPKKKGLLKMSINVVHVVDDLNTGGLERTLAIIVKNLDRSKYHVSVWCLLGEGVVAEELKENGIKIEVIDFSISRKIRSLFNLVRKLKKEKVEILHCWGVSGGVWGRSAAILAGVPIKFVHVQNLYYDLKRKPRLIEYLLSFFTDKVIACSLAVKECLTTFIGINENKIETVYNCVDLNTFYKSNNSDHIREDYNLSTQNIIVGSVSRLCKVKGHKFILEAALRLRKKFPHVRFLIVGEGPLKEELEEKIENLGLKNEVILTGLRQDIPQLLSAMDIFVQPSIVKEGLPLAIAEAGACSLAVVASDVGGNSEIVKDQVTGIIFPPGDVDAFSEALSSLIESPSKKREMGEAARKLCEELFSSETMLKKTDDLYTYSIDKHQRKHILPPGTVPL